MIEKVFSLLAHTTRSAEFILMSSFYAPNYCGTFYSVFDDVTQSGIGSPNTNSGSSHTLLSPISTPQPYVPLITQSTGPLSPSAIETSQLSPHILDVPPKSWQFVSSMFSVSQQWAIQSGPTTLFSNCHTSPSVCASQRNSLCGLGLQLIQTSEYA